MQTLFVSNCMKLFSCEKIHAIKPKSSTLPPQRKFLPSGGAREKKLFLIIVSVLGHPKGVGGLTSNFLRGGGMDVFLNDPIDNQNIATVLPRNNLSKTASKTRVSCVHCASTVRPRAPAGASVLRAPCVRLASTVRLRALAGASTVRAPCVRFASAREDAAEKEFSS
jgi:hypothetical protein